MRFHAGARLGPYEIVCRVAAGGMGEVYRAADVRLGRDVALKILSPELAHETDSRRRFEQEARSASALNHPNIITIHDIGEAESVLYLAMEYLEGRTLREVLAAGPLSLRQLLDIAVQVADGLCAAHDRQIVHRDLKPDNLLVMPDGRVKILDFGLAKPLVGAAGPTSVTLTGTEVGRIVGTIGYMSPEQARGRAADARSDEFSFGAVLYEMATGRRAFERDSAVETAAAIITDTATPLDQLCPEMPPPLRWAIERCLAKDPNDRYASTHDLLRDLVAIRDRLSDIRYDGVGTLSQNLPTPRTACIGREREIGVLVDLLRRDDVRWLTLTGPGGVGKTLLSLQVARAVGERVTVFFVPLAAIADVKLVASAIAQALGADAIGGQSPIEAITHRIRAQRSPVLLLIDNFEHVSDAAPVLAELLEACANLKLMVTSRALLHLYGEREFPVTPLPVPDRRQTVRVDALATFPSIELFRQRAVAARPDFQLTAQNAATVVGICARLDGLPMAIELAAARIRMLSASTLLAHLEGRLLALGGGARDLPARQQTIRGAIDWSYDLLTPAEQTLCCRLSVFTGGWTLEAAEAVCNAREDLNIDVFDGLSSLVDKSLVQRVESAAEETRFIMLETIREYALERLSTSGELELTRQAHAAYCLVLAEESASLRVAAEHTLWLSRCDDELANFRAALDHLQESGAAEWGVRLAVGLLPFWQTRGYLAEARERLSRLLEVPAMTERAELRARALFALGTLAVAQRDFSASFTFHSEALPIYRTRDDRKGIAITLNGLGVTKLDEGDCGAARSFFEESVAVWREVGDERATARTLSNFANAVKTAGDAAHSRRLYQECRDIFQRLGDQAGLAWSLVHEGDAARDEQDVAGAKILYQEALDSFRPLADGWGIATALMSLGHLAYDEGDAAAARHLYEQALDVFWKVGDRRGVARLVEALASLAAGENEAVRALKLAGSAAALRHVLSAPLLPAERVRLDRTLEPVRRGKDAAAAASAWMEGWSMSLDEAVRYAHQQG